MSNYQKDITELTRINNSIINYITNQQAIIFDQYYYIKVNKKKGIIRFFKQRPYIARIRNRKVGYCV